MLKLPNKQSGFTLIELLLVIAIISALAVVVFVSLNPAQRLSDSRNARRTADIDSILSAIHSSIVDNKGKLPAGLTTTEQQLGTAGSGCVVSTGTCSVTTAACLDMSTTMVKYLKTIPIDPSLASTSTTTNYSVVVDVNNIVTVKACGAEATPITVSR